MSSKRKLYKPAPAAQTPPQAARRSLPQGHLTSTDSKPPLTDFSPSVSEAIQSPSLRRGKTPGSHAKRSLDYNSAMASTEKPSSPSRYVSPSITHSPAKVQPSASLSLSEPEDEVRKTEVEPSAPSLESSVLAVDATNRHASRIDSEVPIKASYIKSPAKVVCHSPKRKTASHVRGSPHHGNAGKFVIPVESVPSVNVSAILPRKSESQSSCSPPLSEDGSLSTVAGSPVDPRSKAVETVVVQEKGNPRSFVSFLDSGSCSDMSEPTRKDIQSICNQSEVRAGQPNFDETGVSSIAGNSRLDSGFDEVARKKKKKTRVVQSKYMTSAMSRIGDKPGGAKRSDGQPSRNAPVTRTSAKSKKPRAAGILVAAPKETGNESIVTNVKKPLHTSTPAEVPHQFVPEDSKSNTALKTERSSLPAHLTPSHLTTSKEKGRSKASKDVSSKEIKSERPTQTRSGKQTGVETGQLQLDLMHARLCQWRFLRLKQEKAFKEQEKKVQQWFYSMSEMTRKEREKNHELRMNLNKKLKEEEIDKQLELQLKVLRTLDEQTRRLFPNYEKFYEGIDTTRHHISLQDILIPQNEDEMLDALQEFESNAEEVAQLLQNNESKILSFSGEMQTLAEIVRTEAEEQERCTELLAAANSLITTEQSLKAELIENSER
ncbi:uncharacterized protein LOC114516179 [Dendronephthya gigantea]|uniref:uncharacterized protein LOC114516179 n=1 Tax=Dendronephthya gigantea TaxID=151771 RepID=UPI00106C6DC5|nr:uncharacterized protein LOC114516179 [Dendronephthya gigantea]